MKKITITSKTAEEQLDGKVTKKSIVLAEFTLNIYDDTVIDAHAIEAIKKTVNDIAANYSLPKGEVIITQVENV